jgi:hypothetical protein
LQNKGATQRQQGTTPDSRKVLAQLVLAPPATIEENYGYVAAH